MALAEDIRNEWQAFTSHEDAIAETCGMLNAVTARLVRQIAVVLERAWWQGAGIRSPAHWVSLQCNVALWRARNLVAIAARLDDLPVTFGAFEAGRLTEDSTALVCRRCPAHNDGEMAEFARFATVSQLRRTLREYPLAPLPGEEQDEHAERRSVRFGPDSRGDWRFGSVLPPDEAATVEKALERARYDLEHDGDVDGLPARDVSYADAFVHLASTYLTIGQVRHPNADKAHLYVHVQGVEDPERPGHMHLGDALPEWLRRYLSCDADLQVVFDEAGGRPVALGRTQHTAPPWLRRLVENRDGGCVVPGCPARRRLQIHHIWHWEHGGPTDEWNLVALCRWHHRQHHKGLLGISGVADALEVTDQLGYPIRARPPNPPPEPPEVPHEQFVRPSGERLDLHCAYFRGPPNSN